MKSGVRSLCFLSLLLKSRPQASPRVSVARVREEPDLVKTPLAVAAISVGPTASGGAQPWWPTALLVNEERSEVFVFSMSVVV